MAGARLSFETPGMVWDIGHTSCGGFALLSYQGKGTLAFALSERKAGSWRTPSRGVRSGERVS
ncbi:MAG: hypothetical protein BLITH_1052 [Brockia lithotrophica]|uniref:Uncharacterized protein n=1 Tax=Brockia lithotrophica TaxID=933949 RepID=A0A2T5G7C6_9BACL|nr:MAG: hypothetical protein BLITH_1052 [Brockia lithotrophica]